MEKGTEQGDLMSVGVCVLEVLGPPLPPLSVNKCFCQKSMYVFVL